MSDLPREWEPLVARAVDVLLEDSGLPLYGGHRATVERRQRLALSAVSGELVPRAGLAHARGRLRRWNELHGEAVRERDAALTELNRLREAARRVLGDHMAGRDIVPALNALEDAAGFSQQGQVSKGVPSPSKSLERSWRAADLANHPPPGSTAPGFGLAAPEGDGPDCFPRVAFEDLAREGGLVDD